MLAVGNLLPASNEMTARTLINALREWPHKALIFVVEGRTIRPGYHVTEVKYGRFTALDCGANPEKWSETFIQLWDVDEPPRIHMPAGKFVSIIEKVAQLSPFDPDTKLTFEFSDGTEAIRLLRALKMDMSNDRIVVTLGNRAARCKPRDRWLVASAPTPASNRCGVNSVQSCCT